MTLMETSVGASDAPSQKLNRNDIIEAMQRAAPEGLDSLPAETYDQLQQLTSQLVEADGSRAIGEYNRYNDVAKRELGVNAESAEDLLSGKNVLVIGGTGLIGSALIRKLQAYNPATIASISRGVTNQHGVNDGTDYRFTDIRDTNGLDDVFRSVSPDVVFHVAADKYNHSAELRARHTLTTNIEGTRNVVKASELYGAEKLIYASTGKAARPFSPDVYASSKKAGEWLVSGAAERGRIACAAARFTHVVDDSNVRAQILQRMQSGEPVRLQHPEVLFYIQSARESADLLINAGSAADTGALPIHAIRDLEMPINLTDLGLGAIARHGSRSPIYFTGVQQGYEDKAWPALYDPANAGDVSPLFCSLEAGQADVSEVMESVDVFPLTISTTNDLLQQYEELRRAYFAPEETQNLRIMSQRLSWAMLDARLRSVPTPELARVARRCIRLTSQVDHSDEHARTSDAIIDAYHSRIAAD